MKQFLRYTLTLVAILIATTNVWAAATCHTVTKSTFETDESYQTGNWIKTTHYYYSQPQQQFLQITDNSYSTLSTVSFTVTGDKESGAQKFKILYSTGSGWQYYSTTEYSLERGSLFQGYPAGTTQITLSDAKIKSATAFGIEFTNYNANGSGNKSNKRTITISNVSVTFSDYFHSNANGTTLDFGSIEKDQTSEPKTFTYQYNNKITSVNWVSDNDMFSVSAPPHTEDCSGEQEVSITYTPTEIRDEITGTITGTAKTGQVITIYVKGSSWSSAAEDPTYTWNTDIWNGSAQNRDIYVDETINNLLTYTSSSATCTYSIEHLGDNGTTNNGDAITTFAGNTLVAGRAGTYRLTVTQSEATGYNAGTTSIELTIKKHQTAFYLDLKDEYLVDEIDNNLFSTTTDLTGRTINVSDSKNYFTYSNGELQANCPTKLPANSDTTTITVTQPENYKWTSYSLNDTVTVKKYTTEFSWLLQPTYLVGEEITSIFNKSANGLSSTITSSDSTIVEVVDNSKLVAHRAGKVTIAIEQTVDRKWTAFRETKEITINKRNSNFQLLLGNTYYVDDQIADAQIYSKDNNNSAPIHITSSDTNILEYDATNHKLIAKKKGTATIRVWQEKDTTWTEFDQSITVNVIKHTPEFKWQGKVCSHGANCANTTTEYFNEPYTDYFTTNNTATPISIVQQTDTNVANMYFVDGDTHTLDLTVFYKEAASTQQPYYTDITIVQDSNRYWEYHTETHRITPKNEDNHVEFLMNTKSLRDALFYAKENNHGEITCSEGGEISLNQNSAIVWTANPLYYTIRFEGIPDELSFEYKMTRTATAIGDTRKAFIVYQSEDGNSWEEIWTTNGMPSNTSYEKVENEQLHKPLSKKTRFLKFFYDGTYTGYYRNIHVTELNQFEFVPNTLDFGEVKITDNTTKTINTTFQYANAGHKINIDLDRTGAWEDDAEYELAKQYITINPTSITDIGGEKVGKTEIQITLHSDDRTPYTIPDGAKIKIWDEAGRCDYLSISGLIEPSEQEIYWSAYFQLEEPIAIPLETGDVKNAATASSNLPITYKTDNPEVIQISDDKSYFTPIAVGDATITAIQDGNQVYDRVESSKKITVTQKMVQIISWPVDFTDLILVENPDPIPLTAATYLLDLVNNRPVFSQEQTDKIEYSVENEEVVKIVDGQLVIVGLGSTTITAAINESEDSHYESTSTTLPVIVREPAVGCEDMLLLDQPNEVEIFTDGMNTNEIVKNAMAIDRTLGIPGRVEFQHKGEAWKLFGSVSFYAGAIKVQQSTDGGNTWSDVPNTSVTPTQSVYNTSVATLDRNATHIRFVRPSGGQGYHYYKDVKVYPAQYLESATTSINYENINVGGTYTKKINISYSNIKSPIYYIASSSDITVSPKTFGECGKFGTQELTITWKPSTNIGQQTVTFRDSLSEISDLTINLTANIDRRKQEILWENRPEVILSHTGIDNRPIYTIDANSKAPTTLKIEYTVVEGTENAYFSDDMFFILNEGEITIKAANDGNEEYAAIEEVYNLTLQGVPPTFIGGTDNQLWNNENNWKNKLMPSDEYSIANITAPVEINNLLVDINNVRVADNASIHITSTGGLTVGVEGIQCANNDGSAIIIDNLHSGAGFFRINPNCKDELPRITMRYQTNSTLDNGANKDAEWQYIGAPGEDASVHVDYNTWLYRLDESQADWVLMPQNNNHTLSPFQGYALTQYGQPTYEWNAQMINRNCTIPLTYNFDGRKGQNLIANSYTAPIDVTQMTSEDFQMIDGQREYYNITQTLYLYNSGSWNAWHTQDSLGTGINLDGNNTTPGQYYAIPVLAVAKGYIPERPTIAPMQGIYVRVRAKKTGGDTHVGNIIFNYDRIVMGEGHDMHRPMRAPQTTDQNTSDDLFRRVRIVANSSNSGSDRLYIIQAHNTTRNYDNGYDAPNQATQGIVNIYTYESGGKMEVSCANNIDSTYIGFMAGEDRTYTLHFNAIIGETLCLQDLTNGEKINIVEGGTYTFEAEPQSTNNQRFLLLAPQGIKSDIDEIDSVNIWYSNRTLYITNAADNSTLQLYDVSGHQIFSTTIHRTPYTIDLTHLTEGVYMARVNNQVYKFVCK